MSGHQAGSDLSTAREVVRGDLVVLSEGDRVPAERLLRRRTDVRSAPERYEVRQAAGGHLPKPGKEKHLSAADPGRLRRDLSAHSIECDAVCFHPRKNETVAADTGSNAARGTNQIVLSRELIDRDHPNVGFAAATSKQGSQQPAPIRQFPPLQTRSPAAYRIVERVGDARDRAGNLGVRWSENGLGALAGNRSQYGP